MSTSATSRAARFTTPTPAAVAFAVTLVAAIVAGCGTSTASPSATGAPSQTAGPSATPRELPTLGTATDPLNPTGWPIAIRADVMGEIVVGPDGTLYASGLMPVDRTGHGRTGWLKLPDGSYLVPATFTSDGSAFGDSGGQLWAIDPSGKPRSGWPIDVAASSWAVGPGGSVYLMQWPTEGSTKITILDEQAAPVTGWSVAKVLDYSCDYLIQPDGTFWLTYPVMDTSWWASCEIHAFGPDGRELSTGKIEHRWSGMSNGPTGIVAAWYYEFAEDSQERPARTRVAVLGRDGKPAAGWPVTLEGAASPPAYGADGSLYFTVLADGGNQVVALDASGKARPGWPVKVAGDPLTVAAAGTEPAVPQSPIVGGPAVYVATQDRIEAFDQAGSVPVGWPFKLPAAWDDSGCAAGETPPAWNTGPVFAAAEGSAAGRLYLGLEGRLVALGPDGAVAAGWPYDAGAGFVCWRQLDATPDGGLIATAYYKAGVSEHRIVRLTPEGTFPK